MRKRIHVDELTTGMYVTDIVKCEGGAKIKAEGLVKNQQGVNKLKELEVIELEIDLSKSKIENHADALLQEQESDDDQNSSADEKPETATFENEIGRAKKLYASAVRMQRQALEKIKSTGKLDTKPYEEMATQFFESISRNKDALLCMTKLQDKDDYLLEHSINVGILLAIFSQHLNIPRKIGEKLTFAGLMHDIGKVQIADDILFKQGKLTQDEFDEIKKHTTFGASILESSGMSGMTIEIALRHHERLSGSGYPDGLVSHQINQYVRMSCIVDVYDAITAERVYKPSISPLQAIKIIKKDAGTEFDSKLVDKFIEAVGLFSVGTFVLLKSGKLALVIKSNYNQPLKPIIKVFYHTKHRRHIEPQTVDLSSKYAREVIDKSVNASDYEIDGNLIIESSLINP